MTAATRYALITAHRYSAPSLPNGDVSQGDRQQLARLFALPLAASDTIVEGLPSGPIVFARNQYAAITAQSQVAFISAFNTRGIAIAVGGEPVPPIIIPGSAVLYGIAGNLATGYTIPFNNLIDDSGDNMIDDITGLNMINDEPGNMLDDNGENMRDDSGQNLRNA